MKLAKSCYQCRDGLVFYKSQLSDRVDQCWKEFSTWGLLKRKGNNKVLRETNTGAGNKGCQTWTLL